jgi:hypothetical protein
MHDIIDSAPHYLGDIDVYTDRSMVLFVFPRPIEVPRIWSSNGQREWVFINDHDPEIPAALRKQTIVPYDLIAAYLAMRGITLGERDDE